MNNQNVGTITYNAVINTSGLDDGANKVTSVLGGIGKVAAAAVAAGAVATAGLVAASVKAYADYEQLTGGIDTLFKDSSQTIQNYAQNAYQTAGLSANKYMETITSFSATMLQGLNGDTAKAAEASNAAVVDMSDNANKMGTSMEMISNAYQGFAKDNFTMLDNLKLGYGGTQEEMARLINDSGVMGEGFKATAENVKDIPFDKITEGIHKIQTELGITGTTAKEASETISGAFNATKASWENVLTAFGTGNNEMIKNSIDGLITSATNLVTNVSAIIPQILGGIGQLITAFVEQLPTLFETLIPTLTNFLTTAVDTLVTAVPQFLEGAIKLVVALAQGLAQSLPTLIPKLIDGLMNLIQVIIDNLPTFIDAAVKIIVALATGLADAIPKLIPVIIEAAMTILDTLLEHLPELIEAGIKILVAVIQGLADALPKLIEYLPKIITTLVEQLTKPEVVTQLVYAALQIIIAIAGGLIKAIPQLIKAVPDLISALIKAFVNIGDSALQIGKDLVTGIWNGINNAKDWVLGKIKGFGNAILDGIKGFFGIHSPSTLFRDEIGKNLALGVGEGFTDGMDDVSKAMQNAIPTPTVDIDSIGNYEGATAQPTTIVVQVGDETLLTKIIDGINDKSMLSGYNAIKV